VWNQFSDLHKCLNTLKLQKYKDFEVIIVDDCSDEGNINNENLDEYQLNIKVFRLDKRTGGNGARNFGFDKSRGEYVVFADADLEFREDYLEILLQALEENLESSYSYPSFRYGKKNFPLYEFDAEKMKRDNYVPIAALIRREHFPGFDESLNRFQDWDLWLTMLEQGHKGVWVRAYLYKANIEKGTKSRWLPKVAYRIPFIFKQRKEEYRRAKEIVMKKHGLIGN